jgi:hypothetical protein
MGGTWWTTLGINRIKECKNSIERYKESSIMSVRNQKEEYK